ncbi:hypothetical protein EV696_10465 [Permianibacter aggregans]|uniref:Uncharacterized protein n=2 Tax=Permianibacter aggregans TaxID=1510150 RepID=A0A4R6UQP7_9GAMM|nr:hypothetical protein EV696_10465 [Permianibacter aggregans]
MRPVTDPLKFSEAPAGEKSASVPTLAELTRRYARFSRSAGGLSSVLGGVLCIGIFLLGLALELNWPLRIALANAPFVWLLSKELLTRFYYQRHGRVEQRVSDSERRWHIGFTAFVALVSLVIIISVLIGKGLSGITIGGWGYLLVVALMPFVVWRWLWSSSDFIVGVSMICQSAVFLGGGHYQSDWLGAYLLFAGLLAILLGVREHREFLRLRQSLFGAEQ